MQKTPRLRERIVIDFELGITDVDLEDRLVRALQAVGTLLSNTAVEEAMRRHGRITGNMTTQMLVNRKWVPYFPSAQPKEAV